MKILSWNISWSSKKEKILDRLKIELDTVSSIVCLQEVTPSVKTFFQDSLSSQKYHFIYSLDYRYPGEFDSKSRKLGILIITTSDIEIVQAGVLPRVPFPDRTAFIRFKYCSSLYTLMSLHSVTGVNYKKGKSVQFDSFAEEIKRMEPDIVTFDANEPKVDHYDLSQMVFFDNGDKGAGAKHFFNALSDADLSDTYSLFYNSNDFKSGRPLTTSHVLSTGEHKRYDFIFAKDSRLDIRGCLYYYNEALAATADHAYVVAWSDMEMRAAQEPSLIDMYNSGDKEYSISSLLQYCRFYDPTKPYSQQDLIGSYELRWMNDMIDDKRHIMELVNDYIYHNLETFNINDGVPISLKALLFNRYAHWNSYVTAEGFKKWYRKAYLKLDISD